MEEPITLDYAPKTTRKKWGGKRKLLTGLAALAFSVSITNRDLINKTLGYNTGYFAFENLPNWEATYSDLLGPQMGLVLRYKNNYTYGWINYDIEKGFDSHLIIKDLSLPPKIEPKTDEFQPRVWMLPKKYQIKSIPSS